MDTEAGPGKDVVRSDSGECIVVGIGLEQKTGSLRAENLQNLTFWKSKSDHVDLLRGSAAATTTTTTTNADVRATFTCPVMSRRHARIIFTGNGTVTITDLGSLHGTFVKSNDVVTKLVPNKPHTLMSGDLVTLGKSVNRDDRQWEPVSLQVRLITEDSAPAKDVVTIDALSPGATDTRSSPSLHTLPKSDPQPASTNRFGFYPSSETSSSEMSTSDIDDEDDAHSDEDDSGPRVAPDGTSSPPVGTPISDRLWSTLPIFCGVMRRAKTRSPLPSIHQLGLSSSLLNSFSGSQAPSLPHCNTDDFSADASNMSTNTNSSSNTIGHVTQNIIDLTAVDEIPFPSSIIENQLGAPIEQFGTASHLNVGSGVTASAADSGTLPSKRVVYDSDGNELSDGEGDDDDDGRNLDELDDEEEQDGDYIPDEGWNEEGEDEEGEDDEDGEGDEDDDDEDKDEDDGDEDEDEDEEDEDEEDYESHHSGASSPMQISSGAPSANATRASSPEFPGFPLFNPNDAFSWDEPRTVPSWTTPQQPSMTGLPVMLGPGNSGVYYDYSGAGGNVVNGGVSNGGQIHTSMNSGVNTSGGLGGQMNGNVYGNLYPSSSGWNTASQTAAAQLAPTSYPIPSTLPPLSTYHRPTNIGYGYFAPPSTPAVMNEPQRLTPPTSHPMATVAPVTSRSASDSNVTVPSAPVATVTTTTTPYVTTPYVGCVGGVQNAPTQVNGVKLIEDSRSSLFSQEVVNGNEDENNSGEQQQAQTENQEDQGQYDRASRTARIVSQISALSSRLGRPAVEAQIKAGVSRLFWGESVQERAANAARQKKEEEEKERERKEEEVKRKEEIRSIMREELTRTSNNLEARFDDGVLEVLAKLDNPLPIRVNGDQSVQTDPLQEKEVQLYTPEMDVDDDNHECVSASPLSKKRKRSEVEAEEEASTASSSDVESNSTSTLTVVSAATQTEPPPSPAALVSNDTEPCTGTVTETRTETSVDPSPRPGKRMRFWRRRSTSLGSDENQRKNEMTTKRRSFTSAAGLVSLGVVATYAVLANVSEEWIDRMAERYV